MKTNHLITALLSLSLLFATQASGKIGLIVNRDLYPSLRTEIKTYRDDIVAVESKQVWIDSTHFRSTSPIASLRDTLAARFRSDNLEGAVFIGDLPIANYEVENDHDTYGYAEFPCEIYFMDLDGNWLDNAHDGDWSGSAKTGWFDDHAAGSGNIRAEIWVSRIIGSTVPGLGDGVTVLRDYFGRVHRRMTGSDPLGRKMLICGNDTEWAEVLFWAGANSLGYAVADVTTYLRSTPATLDSKANWIAGLRAGQEYAAIFEHSSATSNGVIDNFTSRNYLDMPGSGGPSNTRFYNLFTCSNGRYTVPDFLGGLYAWGHNGLLCVGTTKTGGMQGYAYFNPELGAGKSFGETFKYWLNEWVLYTSSPRPIKIFWHYGMVLCGAGTLRLHNYPPLMQTITIDGRGFEWMYFGSVNVPPQGVQIRVRNPEYRFGTMFTVRNTGSSCMVDVQWYGVSDQNSTDCRDRTANLIGNGAQINNVCTPKRDDGGMYFILRSRNSATHNEAIELFNWRNGSGCR